MRLSYSKISTFDQCALRFAHRYLWHTPKQAPPVSSKRGVALHSVFEVVAKQVVAGERDRKADPRPAMVKVVKEEFKKEKLPVVEHAAEVAAAIQSFAGSSMANVVEAEYSFHVAIAGHELEGRIDRIDYDEATGEWCVIDYKSGKVREKYWLDRALQMTIYIYVVHTEKKVPLEKIIGCYDFVKHNKKIFTTRDAADMGMLPRKIAKVAEGIEDIRAQRVQPQGCYSENLCKMCEYRSICPVFKLWEG